MHLLSSKPVHGLIFLFKFLQHEEPSGPVVTDNRLDKIYFAKQLTKLKEFSMSFDPRMRGLTLSNSQTIRTSHNSMSPHAHFEFDQKMGSKVSS
ncbi:hypothetical protein MSG28_012631 [Choristoneura fumiferana]|uniref:Uncharacterized protein n=1 Tax=Choristoneura fumiferana TaxID=7141 RepID=A0ACC0JH99_CHOFU|nr:hypothetical protein MSG28_012631 [Choristoneura fumiferana]